MAITIRCLGCGTVHTIGKGIGNRVIVCPACQGLMVQSGNEPAIDSEGRVNLADRTFSFVCQKCQAVLDFAQALAGSQTTCPRCKSSLTAPIPKTQYPELAAAKTTAAAMPSNPGPMPVAVAPPSEPAKSAPPPAAHDRQYFFSHDGMEVGPVSSQQLKSYAESGRLQRDDLVWISGTTRRVPASQLQGLFDTAPAAACTVPTFEPSQANATLASATAGNIGVDATTSSNRARSFLMEPVAVATTTLLHLKGVANTVQQAWKGQSAAQQARDALYRLGLRLEALRFGDATTLCSLAAARQRATSAGDNRDVKAQAEGEIWTLLVSLADQTLSSQSPVPQAEPELQTAHAAKEAAEKHHHMLIGTRQRLWPSDRANRLRLAAGYAVLGCAALFVFGFFPSPFKSKQERAFEQFVKLQQSQYQTVPRLPSIGDQPSRDTKDSLLPKTPLTLQSIAANHEPAETAEPGAEPPKASEPDVSRTPETKLNREPFIEFTPTSGHVLGVLKATRDAKEFHFLGYSPEGKRFAFFVSDNDRDESPCRVILYDPAKRIELVSLNGARAPIAFSADGNRLATNVDGQIALWNVDSGARLSTLLLETKSDSSAKKNERDEKERVRAAIHSLTSVVFSGDGKAIAARREKIEWTTAGIGASVQVFGVDDGKRIGTAFEEDKPVQSVALSQNGDLLATGYTDGTINLWDVNSQHLRGSQRRLDRKVIQLCFTPDSKSLISLTAAAKGAERIHSWDIAETLTLRGPFSYAHDRGQPAKYLDPHITEPSLWDSSVALRIDERGEKLRVLSSVGSHLTFSDWELKGQQLLCVYPIPIEQIQFDRFDPLSPDLTTVVTEGTYHTDDGRYLQGIILRDMTGYIDVLATPRAVLRHPVKISGAAFTADGNQIVTAGGGNWNNAVVAGASLWNAKSAGALDKPGKRKASRFPLEVMTLSRTGQLMAASPKNNSTSGMYEVLLWDVRSDSTKTVDCPIEPVALAISPDDQTLAIGFKERRQLSPRRPTAKAGESEAVPVMLYDVQKSKWKNLPGNPFEDREVSAIAFSHRGDCLVFGFRNAPGFDDHHAPPVVVRTLKDGQDQLVPVEGWVHAIDFSPDDNKLVAYIQKDTAAGDKGITSIIVVDIASGKRQLRINAAPNPIHEPECFALSPVGQFAAAGGRIVDDSGQYNVAIYDLNTGRLFKSLRWPGLKKLDRGEVRSVAFSPDGESLVAVDDDFTASIWDWKSGGAPDVTVATPQPNNIANAGPSTASKTGEPDAGGNTYRNRSLDEWLQQLDKGNTAEREEACEALSKLAMQQPEAIVPVLAKHLDDKDKRVASSAFDALRHLGPKAKLAVPKFIEILKRTSAQAPDQEYVIMALGNMGPEAGEAVPVLFDVLLDESGKYSGWQHTSGVPGLNPIAAQDTSTKVRNVHVRAVIKTLGQIGEPAVDETVARLHRANQQQSFKILPVLHQLAKYPNATAALPRLTELLKPIRKGEKAPQPLPKGATIGGLRPLEKDQRMAEEIYASAANSVYYDILSVVAAFGERVAAQPELPETVCDIMLAAHDSRLRASAEGALVAMGQAASIVLPRIKNAVEDKDPDVRRYAENVLRRLDPLAYAEAMERRKTSGKSAGGDR